MPFFVHEDSDDDSSGTDHQLLKVSEHKERDTFISGVCPDVRGVWRDKEENPNPGGGRATRGQRALPRD